MKEISLHILDIAQNALHAGATRIVITVLTDTQQNLIAFEVMDNGAGMDSMTLSKLNDPFFTTGNKKTGLGIPLLKQHAEAAGGRCLISSKPGEGTKVKAEFLLDHIDRQPLGDLAGTLISLIQANPELEWEFTDEFDGESFRLSTRDIKAELEDMSITDPQVMAFIRDMLRENIEALSK